MPYNIRMFDSRINVVVVEGSAYSSIVAHSHEFVEIVLITEGLGVSVIGDKRISVKKGDLFIVADRLVNHFIQPEAGETELAVLNIIFPFDFYDANYSFFKPEIVYNANAIDGLMPIIERIKREYNEKDVFYENITFALTSAVLSLLMRATPKLPKVKNDFGFKQKQLESYIDGALKFIKMNYDKQITVGDVASACNVSRSYIQHLFKKEHNTTIKEYLIKHRIEQSCKLLLHTEHSISSIAEMVGFNDLKHFYLKFKEIVKETPNGFKQSHLSGEYIPVEAKQGREE